MAEVKAENVFEIDGEDDINGQFSVPELDQLMADAVKSETQPAVESFESFESVNVDIRSVTANFRPHDTISWSKNGFIAYQVPKPDQKDNLLLTYLENIDGKSWQLAQPQRICVKPNTDHSAPPELTLVRWSSLSTDLAVADVFGNFYILLSGVGLVSDNGSKDTKPESASINGSPNYELTSYNHLEFIYRDIISQQTNQQPHREAQFVAFEWLGIEKPQFLNKYAKLINLPQDQASQSSAPFAYSYGVGQFQPKGLCHPISTKQACVALRRNGQFVLYFQGEHKVEYHKTTIELNEGRNYDLDVTMASIGFHQDKRIIVTLHDGLSNKIRTYGITIDWGYVLEAAQKQKVEPHYNTPKELQKSPTLTFSLLHEMYPLTETLFDTNDDDREDDEDNMDTDDSGKKTSSYRPAEKFATLSGISVLSPTLRTETELDIMIYYNAYDENFNWSTTIYRYHLVEQKDLVSSAFTELGSRKNISDGTSKETEYILLLQDKLWRPNRIASLMTWPGYDQFFLIVSNDGTIDILHRDTLAIMDGGSSTDFSTYAPDVINSLFEVGFKPPKINLSGKNPFMIGFSPLMTSVAYIELNSDRQQLTLNQIQKNAGTGISARELFMTSVGFAYHHAFACYTNTCSDDLLLLIQREIKRVGQLVDSMMPENDKSVAVLDRFIESIICESHKAINFQLDIFNKESVDKLLSNPPLQKLLSLQLVLGDLQDHNKIVSDIAWIVLNLRSTSFAIMFSLSSIYRQISKKKTTDDTLQDSITRSEAIISLTGSVRWLIDMIAYLNQEIIHLAMSSKTPEKSKLNYHNSLVLPVLISKVPRLFLMYALSSIGKTHEILKKLHKDLSDSNKLFTPMKEALNRYFTACSNSPLNLNIFEVFLRECDAMINKEMQNNSQGKSRGYTLKLEQKLVCQGSLNEETIKIGQKIVQNHTAKRVHDLRVADLYYHDVDWIDIGMKKSDFNRARSHALLGDQQIFYQHPLPPKEMTPRHMFSSHECVDALRKIIISIDGSPVRKCTRCRSISLINEPLIYNSTAMMGLWTMVFQRTCVCGSAWISLKT